MNIRATVTRQISTIPQAYDLDITIWDVKIKCIGVWNNNEFLVKPISLSIIWDEETTDTVIKIAKVSILWWTLQASVEDYVQRATKSQSEPLHWHQDFAEQIKEIKHLYQKKGDSNG